jgi:hypothetical protein
MSPTTTTTSVWTPRRGWTPDAINDGYARRVAKRAGYIAKKSRRTGGFTIINPQTRFVAFGWDADLTPAEVVEWCERD